MSDIINVRERTGGRKVQIPIRSDGSVGLETLKSVFPNATGMVFVVAETGALQVVDLIDGNFQPPTTGWTDKQYFCSFPEPGDQRDSSLPDQRDSSLPPIWYRMRDFFKEPTCGVQRHHILGFALAACCCGYVIYRVISHNQTAVKSQQIIDHDVHH